MKVAQPCRSLIFATFLIAVCLIKTNGFALRPSLKFRAQSSASFAVAVTDEKTNKFLSWAEEEGIKAPKCAISKFPGGLRGIGAVDDIPDSFYSVSVPADLVIETNNNRPPSPFLEFCSESYWSEQCKWDHRLALKLIYEMKGFDKKSTRQPWIDKLPKSFSTPLHWTQDELSGAQYSALEVKVIRQVSDWQAFYSKWVDHIGKSTQISQVSLEEFIWAMECVNSRAFSGIYEGSTAAERRGLYFFTGALTLIWPLAGLGTAEQSLGAAVLVAISIISKDFFFSRAAGLKRYVICPYIDMFNHKSTCTSDVSYGYFTDTFELKTQGYKEGEQIFISYGKQSNDRLLQYYGFTDLENPYDLYDFGANFLELILKYADEINDAVSIPTSPSPQERLQQIAGAMQNTAVESSKDTLLQKSALTLSSSEDKTTRYFKTASSSSTSTGLISHFDDITVRSMRALYSSAEEWDVIVKQSGGSSDLNSLNNLGTPLSADTEGKVSKALNALVRLELARKPTSVEDDVKELEGLVSKQSVNGKKSKGDSIRDKKDKDASRKGFGGKAEGADVVDGEGAGEVEKRELAKRIEKKENSAELDPSGFYNDIEFAALTFRIQKKNLLLDALTKSET